MTSMPDLLYGLRNICCTTFHKLESLLFPFLFFINCLCNKIIRWDVASNSAPTEISKTHLLGFPMCTQNFYPIFSQ